MRESAFVQQRQDRWREIEHDLSRVRSTNPDRLAEDYIELTDDLAIATAQFPQSRAISYLHRIAARAHAAVVRNRRTKFSDVIRWLVYTVPITVSRTQRHLFFSLCLSLIVGIASAYAAVQDDEILRSIMGDGYVDMTADNIANGNPMAVYGQSSEWIMFIQIALNNVYVMFIMVVLGLIPYIGPAFYLIRNMAMIGAFHGLFIVHGAFSEFMLGVYIHGAVEITCVIISAGAGFALGDGILFPRSYSRSVAFVRSTRAALRLCVSLIPFIILAAALESFVTRHAALSPFLNVLVILTTFASIVAYFVVLPKIQTRRYDAEPTLH
ncbi:MAG TPA: hypothetical protein DIS79_04300 [Bacteroidetes bacterium]|nr:hypothetical protein [Bacteroidota bacterium]HRK04388.1 stage II sporulation protein M [Chlorobiota bacterium]